MNKVKPQHLFLVIFTTVFLLILDPTSLASYIYTLIIFTVINTLINESDKNSNFVYFHFYLSITIIIYLYQRLTIPGYLGLSGPGGVGTDDVRYYAWLLEGNVPYNIKFNIYGDIHPYANLLKIIYPFQIYNPLNILIINVLGITFLPFYVNKLTFALTNNNKVSDLAQKFTLFCPYSMAMGLIIMRDMLITTLVFASLYYFLQRKYYPLIFLIPLILYIRFGSIIFFIMGVIVFSLNNIRKKAKNKFTYYTVFILFIGFILVIYYFMVPNLDVISSGKLSSGIFRGDFFYKLSSMDENATILKLISLPIFLRTFALTLFFYFLPFLNFNIFPEGILNIRSLLVSISPIYMLFLWPSIFKTLLYSFFSKHNQNNIKEIVWLSILFALALGTVSLQARHKTILFPILYILAAYGWYLPTKRYNMMSIALTILLFTVQIIAITL